MKRTELEKNTTDRREYCVLCHKDTGYTLDTPIGERRFYIEGGGQLCEACYRELRLAAKS